MDFFEIFEQKLIFPSLFIFDSEPDSLILLRDDDSYVVIDLSRLKIESVLRERATSLIHVLRRMSFKLHCPAMQPMFNVRVYNESAIKGRVFMVGGFPDDEVTWRHQVTLLTDMGYCCVVLFQPLYVRYFGEWDSGTCFEYFENTMRKIVKPDEKIITMSHDFGCFWMARFNRKFPQYSIKNIVIQYGDMGYKKNSLRDRLWKCLSTLYRSRSMSTVDMISKFDFETVHSQLFYKIFGYNITWRMCILFNELYEGKLKVPDAPVSNTLFVYGRQCSILYFTDNFRNKYKTRMVEASHWPHVEKPETFNKILKKYLLH